MKRLILLFLFVLAASMILIPAMFVFIFDKEGALSQEVLNSELVIDQSKNIPVKVYRSSAKKVEVYPLEEYVRGVVAAEMPANFELEALKAQALAARTYIVKRIIDKNFSDVPDGGMVTDTVKHQVFKSEEELREQWGGDYYSNVSKINQAINETSGQVITYQGLPITALFFSTSNGYTENSEDYWEKAVPYLRSVTSPWDQQSPKFDATKFVPYSSLNAKLRINGAVLASSNQDWITVMEKTKGERIGKIKIGDKVLTGREVRELFDLPSSSFTWEIQSDGILFHTKGYGHGVGMSQYGADGMAKNGSTAEEIVKHYYTGVSITNIEDWIKPSKS